MGLNQKKTLCLSIDGSHFCRKADYAFKSPWQPKRPQGLLKTRVSLLLLQKSERAKPRFTYIQSFTVFRFFHLPKYHRARRGIKRIAPRTVYHEEKNGRLQWNVCVKALPRVTTRPWPPERLRSTTTRGICTSWIGLLPSFRAWVRFNT